MLHSAVKCLPPQHVHSGMPHRVQSSHSVKTINQMTSWKLKLTRNDFSKFSTLRCAPLLNQVGGKCHKWFTCFYAAATTIPCSVSVHLLRVVVTHPVHQHVHSDMLSSVQSTCSVKIWTLGLRFNKDIIVMLLHCLQFHCPVSNYVKVSTFFVHQHVLYSAVKPQGCI